MCGRCHLGTRGRQRWRHPHPSIECHQSRLQKLHNPQAPPSQAPNSGTCKGSFIFSYLNLISILNSIHQQQELDFKPFRLSPVTSGSPSPFLCEVASKLGEGSLLLQAEKGREVPSAVAPSSPLATSHWHHVLLASRRHPRCHRIYRQRSTRSM